MPYNPKSAENLVKSEPLPDGVASGSHRSRAQAEALAWWGSLSPAERGRVIERAYFASSQNAVPNGNYNFRALIDSLG